AWAAAALAHRGLDRVSPRAASAVLALLVVAVSADTLRPSPGWRDDETLFRQILKETPASPVGALSLAKLYRAQGRVSDARPLAERAVALGPMDGNAWLILADLRFKSGDSP